ncbi:hypothetical protein [Longimicrobium sp.]|jgi:hypothetical protein|uniref:hypothetical protein n=1 Tax=Longimicrobium sp. TaxID=2029185 RepID=UPI002ED8BE09
MPDRTSVSLVVAVVVTCLSAQPAFGQANLDSVKHRHDCRLAGQIVTLGQPANRRDWALRLLPTCGPVGGSSIAKAFGSFRSTETWDQRLEDIVMLTSVLHDARIFDAAAQVAADRSAGKAARIQALRVLFFQLGTSYADPYESFLAANEITYIPIGDYPLSVGTPLPPDAANRAAEIAWSIILSEPGDADLCTAARKFASAARRR